MKKNCKEAWVVIPAYNEENRLGPVIRQARGFAGNVIVVDDGSKDGTAAIAKGEKAVVLRHIVNLGKGAALKTGCDYAVSQGAKVMVTLDADAQHKPRDIPRFLKALENVEMVFGCRTLNRKMPVILRFGNWLITKMAALLYRVSIPDTQSGFRAFTRDAYSKIRWKANDYSMESEMVANVGKHKIKYAIVPIETLYPDRYKGTTVLDGIKIVVNLLRWKVMQNGL